MNRFRLMARRTLRKTARNLTRRARGATLRGAVALRQWISPDDNPFLMRALRTESRKNQPWLAVGVASLLIAVAGVGGWRVWLWLVELGNVNRLTRGRELLSPLEMPSWIGGNPINALAISTALMTAFWALFAARSRAAALLRQESLASTLDGLQMLPIREERWLWMMSLHPALLSLLIGSVGLPIYALALWMGFWSVRDIIGLVFVFAWIGHIAPQWQPAMWKQKGKTPPKLDAATLRAAFLLRSEANTRGQSQAQQLELQRRAQLLLNQSAPSQTASQSATQQDRVLVGENNAPKTPVPVARDGNKGGWGQVGGMGFGIWMLTMSVSSGLLRGSGAAGALGALWLDTLDALPAEVPPLLSAFPLTWPVVLAKIALSPLPFFRFALPPIVVFVPLWIGFFATRNLLLADRKSVV